MERHGGAAMERAFSDFTAIAPPDWKKPWREVFDVKLDWRGDITALPRESAPPHPDAGGSHTLMAELNVAYAEAKRELGNGASVRDAPQRYMLPLHRPGRAAVCLNTTCADLV